MKKLAAGMIGAVAVALLAMPASAQNSKFSALIDKVTIDVASDDVTNDARERRIPVHLPGNKALLIGVSSQIAISTETKVRGKGGGGGSAEATGNVAVSVAVVPPGGDPTPADLAEPGEITFASRLQELSAILGGVLTDCEVGGSDTLGDCTLTDEEIGLLLETTAAHHYNFLWEAPETGDYEVVVTVAADSSESVEETVEGDAPNDAQATVVVGPTLVAVEEVRAAKGGVLKFE